MRKKILSVVLSAIMVFGMTTMAFAENEMTASNMPDDLAATVLVDFEGYETEGFSNKN